MRPSSADSRIWNRNNELSAPLSNKSHLLHDFISQIPRQNQEIIRPHFPDFLRRVDRDVRSRRKTPVLIRVAVNRVIEEIGADSTVVEKRIPLAGRPVTGDRFPLA